MKKTLSLLLTLTAAILLSACATMRDVDSEVRSFAGTGTVAVDATYRIERLPSQQLQTDAREKFDALTDAVLARKGWTRNDAQPRYTVQVDLQVLGVVRFLPEHLFHRLWRHSPVEHTDLPWYRHAVHVLIRDIHNAEAVYESHAQHDGPWTDSINLFPAVLEAALADFPQAVPAPHTVVVRLPASGMEGR
jgi:predicted small secreted protein